MAKKSKNLHLNNDIIEMVETIAEKENRSFTNVLETLVKDYYKEKYNTGWVSGFIKIGKDCRNYKVKKKEVFEAGEFGASMNILTIVADEDIKINEFDIKKGETIYDEQSKDENLNNINKTVLVYQYIPRDEEDFEDETKDV